MYTFALQYISNKEKIFLSTIKIILQIYLSNLIFAFFLFIKTTNTVNCISIYSMSIDIMPIYSIYKKMECTNINIGKYKLK